MSEFPCQGINMKKTCFRNQIALATLLWSVFLLNSCQPDQKTFTVNEKGVLTIGFGKGKIAFSPAFTILFTEKDPKPAMRPAGIPDVKYNVISWKGIADASEQLAKVQRQDQESGDGFDSRILEGEVSDRTANLFTAGKKIQAELARVRREGERYYFTYKEMPYGELTAVLDCSGSAPSLSFEFSAKRAGYYSIGYTGAASFSPEEIEELWQPLIWQEKRFPSEPYMTLAFRCPLPTAFVNRKGLTYGVVAHPSEFPFEPLPVMDNSRFGIAVRNEKAAAQPMLFAPVLGGAGSNMQVGDRYRFKMVLWAEKGNVTQSFEQIATGLYGFKDYRHNDISTLNETLENIVDYSLSEYAWFVDSLKGFAYATDVPGAVKNVSSLHPWEIALVMGMPEMLEKRAWPLTEYMLSREKFLFSLDREQKIQNPSRELHGPVAPVSELAALYTITNRENPFLLKMAEDEYKTSRIRNLDVKEEGSTWQNALALYKATGKKRYLEKAEEGADGYIRSRVEKPQTDFEGQNAFFWTGFTPQWIDLIRLYEATGSQKYLRAAREGARHYAMFCWMSPKIPADSILVNKGGKAPMYWYLRSKGHEQMYSPGEKAPAWRLAGIGLTPESSGTSTGHRAIFMANYAPWMLRLGYYTGDRFLMNIAKAAVIGRYRNFPGYHINTARTTIYEKEDYPLRPHRQLSVNSFHYNHILPMASMLLDYLVTDAVVRSGEKIDFPAEFIEGYAYLQSKFYGSRPGVFYGDTAWLWMPPGLLSTTSGELNYIAARGEDQLMIAFANQSALEVNAEVKIDPDIMPSISEGGKQVEIWENNGKKQVGNLKNELGALKKETATIKNGNLSVHVPPNGLTAVKIKNVKIPADFQRSLLAGKDAWEKDYAGLELGNARAMILKAGDYKTSAYIFLQDDDSVFSEVVLEYRLAGGEEKSLRDNDFPYEFSIPLEKDSVFSFRLSGRAPGGQWMKGEKTTLRAHKIDNTNTR